MVGDIEAAASKNRSGRAGGTSGIKAEHLKAWLRSATRKKDKDTKTCDKVVSVIQVAFQEGNIPETLMWKTKVLIPKYKGKYTGIWLVETIFKICTSIVNSRLRSSIVLHDVLHVFRATTHGDSSRAIVSGLPRC